MKRDAVRLDGEADAQSAVRVERRAFYFEDGSAHFRGDSTGPVFGWYHNASPTTRPWTWSRWCSADA